MNKLVCVLVCLVLVFAICGCTDNANNTQTNNIESTESDLSSTVSDTTNKEQTDSTQTQTGSKEEAPSTSSETISESQNSETSKTSQKSESSKKTQSSPKKEEKNPTSSKKTEVSKTEIAAIQNPNSSKVVKVPDAGKKPKPQNTACPHKNTLVQNQLATTCTTTGYTGDVYCKDCAAKIKTGSIIAAKGHTKTIIKNQKSATETSEGYSGDIYCGDCNAKLSSGTTLPKIQTEKLTYTANNGRTYVVDKNTDIMTYTMSINTHTFSSPYRQTELEILRLCNEERAKVGVAPLTWYEDAYYFTHIRAEEIYSCWGHQRPNGSQWSTVYTDAGVIFNCCYGENLAQFEGWSLDTVAKHAVEAWMNSDGHRANILNPDFHKMTLALDYSDDNRTLSAAEHFFG